MIYALLQVWHRNYLQFKKTWLISLFWTVLEPMMVLGAIGYGLGSYVNNIGGVSYLDFFFPALLCTSSMMVSFFDATYGNYTKLNYHKLYRTMILSPLSVEEVVLGELFWGATKGTFSCIGILLVASTLGLVKGFYFLPALGIIFISSYLFACIGMIVTSIVKSYDEIIYPTSGLIIPMSLFSGTYFPIEQLPFGLKYLSYLLPLTHTVASVRQLLVVESFSWMILVHVLILLILAAIGTRESIRRIHRQLIK
jgi:lipooligosaccharide transport system permease protein